VEADDASGRPATEAAHFHKGAVEVLVPQPQRGIAPFQPLDGDLHGAMYPFLQKGLGRAVRRLNKRVEVDIELGIAAQVAFEVAPAQPVVGSAEVDALADPPRPVLDGGFETLDGVGGQDPPISSYGRRPSIWSSSSPSTEL